MGKLICPKGTLLLGVYLGFGELLKARIIQTVPKIIGVQAARCAPLKKAFQEGLDEIPQIKKGDTLAEGVAIAEPIPPRIQICRLIFLVIHVKSMSKGCRTKHSTIPRGNACY